MNIKEKSPVQNILFLFLLFAGIWHISACDTGEYEYWNGVCLTACDFPLVDETDNSTGIVYCRFPCAPGETLYWNGTCAPRCWLPHKYRRQWNQDFCDYSPCNAPSTKSVYRGYPYYDSINVMKDPLTEDYNLYFNGDCNIGCPYPFNHYARNSRYYCESPCLRDEQWVYYNKTCRDSCEFPLKQRNDTRTDYLSSYNWMFCDFPCLPSARYLMWDDTCWNSCSAPLEPIASGPEFLCKYKCAENETLYFNGTCLPNCTLPHKYRRQWDRDFCDYPCTGSNWLYWNGSCIASCPYPLYSFTRNGKQYCEFPCPVDKYLYYNRTCNDTCELPLLERFEHEYQFCDFPCPSNNRYLMWDDTCYPSCSAPLIPIKSGEIQYLCSFKCAENETLYFNGTCTDNCTLPHHNKTRWGRDFCDYPCPSTSYWLYWNGTCITNCIYPLLSILRNGVYYCEYPGPLGLYLYYNRTSNESCEFPLLKRNESGYLFCDFPCPSNKRYLIWDDTCYASCPSPLIAIKSGQEYLCSYKCAENETLYFNGTCMDSCTLPEQFRYQWDRNFCDYPCTHGWYLYWNGTCKNRCDYPLTSTYRNSEYYCNFPCPEDKYLYYNRTCEDDCQLPLWANTYGNHSFCEWPCGNNYLMWDGTCWPSCGSPLFTTLSGNKYLCGYKCNENQTLYFNGTCMGSCTLPEKYRHQWDRDFCDYPCTYGWYLYWNGTCINRCDYPLTYTYRNGQYYCNFPCPEGKYLYYNRTCQDDCKLPLWANKYGNHSFCEWPCGNQYLMWDDTCWPSCNAPLTRILSGTSKYLCSYKCNENQTLYFNGTCTNNCTLPEKYRHQWDRYFCDYPCTYGWYLYWNGSCISSCPSPLSYTYRNGQYYCNIPNPPPMFLYYNQTSQQGCDLPLIQRFEGTFYCDYPCENNYLMWDGTCSTVCDFPLSTILSGEKYLCSYKCNGSEFLYFNGTCVENCTLPEKYRKQWGSNFCDYPCDYGYFLYWNGSCKADCFYPFVNTFKNDQFYCSDSCPHGKYLYFNQTCLPTCPPPHIRRNESSSLFCDYPCLNGDFLHSNGTCLSGCSYPYTSRVENSITFCDFPCNSTSFFYPDGSCLVTCDSSYIYQEDANALYCKGPCQNASLFYNPEENNCIPQCVPPLEIDSTTFFNSCKMSLKPTTEFIKSTEAVLTSGRGATQTITQATGALSFGSSISMLSVVSAKMFSNIKYLDISYSFELEELLKNSENDFIPFGLNLEAPSKIADNIVERKVPYVFAKHEVPSSFILNFWDNLLILLFNLLAFGLALIFQIILRKKKTKSLLLLKVFNVIRTAAQNFLITQFYNQIGDIIFYALIEYKTINFSIGLSWISFSISTLLAIILLISLWHHFRFLQEYQKIKQKTKKNEENLELEEFIQDHQGYQVLFGDFKDDSLKCQSFLLIFTIYDLLCRIIYTTLFKHPLAQTILFFSLNFLQILYLCIYRPFKSLFDNFQQLLYLVLTLGIYTCVMIMAVLDVLAQQATSTRNQLGKVIVVFNLIFLFSSIAFMASKLIFSAVDVIKSISKKLRRPKVHPNETSLPQDNSLIYKSTYDSEIKKINESINLDLNRSHSKLKTQDNLFAKNSSLGNTSLLSNLNLQKHQSIIEMDNSEIQSNTDNSELISKKRLPLSKKLFIKNILQPTKETHQPAEDPPSSKNLISINNLLRSHNSQEQVIIPSTPVFQEINLED